VDTLGRSLVALDVASAVGGGVLLSTGKTGTSCDVNSSADTSVPADDSLDPDDWTLPDDDAFDVDIPGSDTDFGTGGGLDGGFSDGSSGAGAGNGGEDLDGQDPAPPHTTSPGGEAPRAGVGLVPDTSNCGSGGTETIRWYKNGQLLSALDVATNSITYESGAYRPTWLGPPTDGVLLIVDPVTGDEYTSETVCNNGTVVSNSTTVGPGLLSRKYGVFFKRGELDSYQAASTESFDFPPYMIVGDGFKAIYFYVPGSGYNSGVSGPEIFDWYAVVNA
jgi:hypothetical protein